MKWRGFRSMHGSSWSDPGKDSEHARPLRGEVEQIGGIKQQTHPARGAPEPNVFQFVTLYTNGRKPLLGSSQSKQLLQRKLMEAKARYQLNIACYVMLDDHVHLLYASHFTQRAEQVVDALRNGFAQDWRRLQCGQNSARADFDQPFWNADHHLRLLNSEHEVHTHLNFIHYDPVRHGVAARAADYAWSSFPARVNQGYYPEDWAVHAPPAGVAKVARLLCQTN